MSNSKKYPQLYSKDSTGNIRVWFMSQYGDQYTTTSGVLNGNLTTSDPTTADPKNVGKKNETSGVEQAQAEIEARYKKQLKTGYFTDVNEVDNITFIECMLAQPFNKLTKKNIPDFKLQRWIGQCKFNGNRCIARKSGLWTRKGEKWLCCPHIHESLMEFFEMYPDAVLDGEFYNFELRKKLNELSSIVKQRTDITEEDYEKSRQIVKYYVYDGYGFNGYDEETDYELRKEWIDRNITRYAYIEPVIDYPIKSQEDLDTLFNRLVDEGEEGVILRRLDAPYEHKRSPLLVKLKLSEDSEGVITAIIEGDGNASGLAAKATITWDGPDGKVEFNATFMGKVEIRQKILRNPSEWIGKSVTFLFEGLTGKVPRKPNYARINPDNCFSADR
jgi:ATP-dependent DNA ligase